ncbi:MAG TPA: LamG-like jellyroll fold domain-containing protein, partial [Verrucomicrobiae bacterium]|nr:LamG-like jellyroll fold domain-containing protein [Verrucomicrobiae bacterium]
ANSLNANNFGAWAFSIEGTGGGVGYYGDPASINDHNWHHLVYVMDRANDKITTYLDGVAAHGVKAGGTRLNDSASINVTNAVTIGQDPSGQYGEQGSADIDDLGVWNRALSPLEATTIYIAGVSNLTSFTAPVTLTLKRISGNNVQLSWPSGTLQSAPNVTGPYTSLTNTSPYTNIITGPRQFFRVKQ